MCGIIGYIGDPNPKGILLDGLKRLEYRGYDSAGIAVLGPQGTEVFRSEGRLSNLEEKLQNREFEGCSVGIGHTRWATHGAPTENNAHPHRVGAITLVHNGIIENYAKLREELRAQGRRFTTDTDTEIVAHLFDSEVQSGKTLAQAMTSLLPTLKGSYAFVMLNEKEPDVVAGVRQGAPLVVGVGKNENFIASDVQAILHRTDQIIYLRDGETAICRRNGVSVQNMRGTAVPVEIKTIHWTPDQMDKSGYRHYMLKEIHEQPQALSQTIRDNIDHTRGVVCIPDLAPHRGWLEPIRKITIVACGTARHAGLVGKYYLERFTGLPVDVDFGSEFRYRNPILEKGTLVVLISQSGETADTLGAMREANARGIPTLSICNVRESSLARESKVVLYTNAGPEIGVASTKAFTTQLSLLYMLAIDLGLARNFLPQAQARELTKDLLHLPILAEVTLQNAEKIEQIALDQQEHTFFFYMGRGINYPIAMEGALKLKEISYLHAEGYPAGEIKHGPIALIDRQAAIIVLTPKDKSNATERNQGDELSHTIYEKLMSNVQEVKSRGGQILCIGTEGDDTFAGESRYFTTIPQASWALNPILLSIPIQLLAYYIALQRGTDVDKPRNLAKSVTVE